MKNINFQKKILLSNYTTIKVGGFAEYFSKPRNRDEFINLIKWSNLNNYKSLGLALSGGIDSALLLYYLLNQDYKIKCYTAIDKNNDNSRQAATDIKDLIEKKTGKTVEHFEFIEYEKDHEKGKREKMTEIWTNLFNSNTIDCILTGATQYLKSIDDKWNQVDKKKATDTKWMKGNGTYITYRPFLEHDKTWIKQGGKITKKSIKRFQRFFFSCL